MAVRLIAGRAGSGKTYTCQSQIIHELDASLTDGPRLILLVPEQAGLQMERSLLARSAARALGRCEVLSFRRLAHRILNEATGPAPVPLTATGRQMALRYLIGKHRRSLREFGKVAERGGFIAEISRGFAELFQEAVTIEQLESCARQANDSGDPVAARLQDVALLYRAYLDYLGDRRVDPEAVLDLARHRLDATPWLRDARIWIDGFAGLTQQQVRMIVSLGRIASDVDLALLLDPQRGKAADLDAAPDELSLFARTEQTWAHLTRALLDAGLTIEDPVRLNPADSPRFAGAPLLGQLERRIFSVPIRPPSATASDPAPPAIARPNAGSAAVRLISARDRRTEVEAAVRAIVDLVQRRAEPMRYREIAIVVRDLAPYHDLVSARLRSQGIPFFIDRRRPTYHHPLVQCVRAAASLLGGGRFDEALMLLLKSGLGGLPDEAVDAVENYALAHGLLTTKAWEETWDRPVRPGRGDGPPTEEDAAALVRVETARRALRDRLAECWPAPTQRGHPRGRRWVERLYALLQRLEVTRRLDEWCNEAEARGELDEASEHEQVWAELVKLLDELVAGLGDIQMTGRQFREVLEAGLSEFTLGLVPATLDQILVGSIERSRHPPVRAAFVLGFSDGQFPARLAEGTIFGDQERAFLEAHDTRLGRSNRQQLLDERMLAYIAATRPSEFLWMSHPESDEDGRPTAPSPYWPALCAAVPEARVESADAQGPGTISTAGDLAAGLACRLREWSDGRLDDAAAAPWLSLYDWARTGATEPVQSTVRRSLAALAPKAKAELSKSETAALWPPPYRTSVTRLETFAQCPFRHYATHGLVLEPRPRHEVSKMDLGILYHQVLEQFVNEIIETGTSLREMSAADIAQSLTRLCDHLVPRYAEAQNLDDVERKFVRWRSRLELPTSVEAQRSTIAETPLTPALTEQPFGAGGPDALPALELSASTGERVLVRGKIDRVDLIPVGDATLTAVFDYKRSLRRRLPLDEVYHGLALQLLAYLLVIRDHYRPDDDVTIIPGGAFYLPLLGGIKRVDHPQEAEEEGFLPFSDFKPRGIVDFDWIDRLDPSFDSKWSTAFSVYRKANGEMGYADNSDAVDRGAMPSILAHVRSKMTELAERWIAGDIEVRPARLGRRLPCSHCVYRPVCRFEYALDQTRVLRSMSRKEVLREIAGAPGEDDG